MGVPAVPACQTTSRPHACAPGAAARSARPSPSSRPVSPSHGMAATTWRRATQPRPAAVGGRPTTRSSHAWNNTGVLSPSSGHGTTVKHGRGRHALGLFFATVPVPTTVPEPTPEPVAETGPVVVPVSAAAAASAHHPGPKSWPFNLTAVDNSVAMTEPIPADVRVTLQDAVRIFTLRLCGRRPGCLVVAS